MADRERPPMAPRRTATTMVMFLTTILTTLLITGAYIGLITSLVFSKDGVLHLMFVLVSMVGCVLMFITFALGHLFDHPFIAPFSYLSSLALGIFLYTFVVSVVAGVVLLPVRLFSIDDVVPHIDSIIRISFITGVMSPVVWGLISANFVSKNRLGIKVKGLSKEKVKVILLSDLHLGTIIGKERLNTIEKVIRKERPDMVLIAGDLLDTNPGNIRRLDKYVKRTFSHTPTFAVTGNHEVYNDLQDSIDWMRRVGIHLIRNDVVVDEKAGIAIIGMEDPTIFDDNAGYKAMLDELLSIAPTDKTRILLSHQPLFFKHSVRNGVSLHLSGHTHGGQLWPFGFITSRIYNEGYRGLNTYKDGFLYVCSGTGTWGPPMRVGTYSEIVILELFS